MRQSDGDRGGCETNASDGKVGDVDVMLEPKTWWLVMSLRRMQPRAEACQAPARHFVFNGDDAVTRVTNASKLQPPLTGRS